LAGCSLGNAGGGTPTGGDDDQSLPEKALCQSTLSITGTIAPESDPPPLATDGCVPQGTWTVTIEVADKGDCADVPSIGPFTYTVTGEGHDETISSDATGEETKLQIHADDSLTSACDGSFEHIWGATSGQFHVVDLRPIAIASDGTIAGDGTYQLWSAHP
jgi:hypothetical protein